MLFLPFTASAPGAEGQDGLLEVQAIAPEEGKMRSWFVGQDVVSGTHFHGTSVEEMTLDDVTD